MRGDTIFFTRPLGIKRNAVVLPKNYEPGASSFASQVLQVTLFEARNGTDCAGSTCSGGTHTIRNVSPGATAVRPEPSR